MSPGLTLKFKVATSWVKMLFFLNTNTHSVELCGMSFSVSMSLFLNFTLHSHSSCSQLYFSPFFASRLTPYRPSYLRELKCAIALSGNVIFKESLRELSLSETTNVFGWSTKKLCLGNAIFNVIFFVSYQLQNSNSGLLYRHLTDFWFQGFLKSVLFLVSTSLRWNVLTLLIIRVTVFRLPK